jgi:phage tail sheath gpL-like
MLNATHLPIDPYGNLIPVGCHKSRGTQVLTLADDAVVYASSAFSGKTKVMASTTLAAAGGETITITSKIEGWESEEISVKVAEASTALAISVSGKEITITPKSDTTSKELAAAIAACPEANELVSVAYTSDSAIVEDNKPAVFLDGWDRGNVGIYVLIQADNDIFYGTFTEAETATKTASIPLAAGQMMWEYVMPGHKISAKSTTAGAKVYLTPAKQM